MYCDGNIESFTKSRRDIGGKPTSLESEFPGQSKKPWILIRPRGITFGDLPFRRIWLMWVLPLKVAHMVEEMSYGKVLPVYQDIGCHMIFNINMDGNFTRKSRFVSGGHTTDPLASITYSSAVSRDSVHIAFMLAELNDISVFAANTGHAYLNEPCCEKIWKKSGPEFCSQQVCVMLIVRALYGLKSSGASWRDILAETLGKDTLGYTSTSVDNDVWIKREVLPDRREYYSMLLVYIDDIFFIHKYTSVVIDDLSSIYDMKQESMGPPDCYLVGGPLINIGKVNCLDTLIFCL